MAKCMPSTGCRSRSTKARSTCCSARRAAASRPRFASSRDSSRRTAGASSSPAATSRRCRRRSATSRWCSRAMRCSRICRSPRTSCSGSRCARWRRRMSRAGSTQVADLLGLSGLLDRKPSQLSGGQQQRVALGRAIIAEAPVCLMDEPLSNLDAQLRQDMRAEIRQLQRQLGITMVYVTHDQVEAMSMADRVVLLNRGRIEQNATPVELYERPANTFVARFIGTPPMNLLPLERGARGRGRRGHRGSGRRAGRLRGAHPRRAARAHHARLRSRRPRDGGRRSSTSAPIRSSRAGWARPRSPCAFPGSVGLARGDAARLSWAPGAQHLFERDGVRRADSVHVRTRDDARVAFRSHQRRKPCCRKPSARVTAFVAAACHDRGRAARRARRRRSKSRSISRWPSAVRSRRSSTASRRTSRRRIPASRSSRSTPARTRTRSPRR